MTAVTVHPFGDTDLLGLCLDCGQGPDHRNHQPVSVTEAARMNATGSPTGRVRAGGPPVSVQAARRVRAPSARTLMLTALLNSGVSGLTSIQLAALLPPRGDGHPQPPNIAGARLSELWEEGRATIKRQWGVCVLGVCHAHDKPTVVHRATAACAVHGEAETRDGASVWVAVANTPR